MKKLSLVVLFVLGTTLAQAASYKISSLTPTNSSMNATSIVEVSAATGVGTYGTYRATIQDVFRAGGGTQAESTNAAQTTQISNLQGGTNGLNTRVANLDGATNGLSTRATNLEGATNGLTTRATNLEGATNGLLALVNTKAPTNSPTFYGSITLVGSGGYMWSGLGTNAGTGTNFTLDVAMGDFQWLAATGSINFMHSTNTSTNSLVGKMASISVTVDLLGRGNDTRLSWPTNWIGLGALTTNGAVLASNQLHKLAFEVGPRTNAETFIAIGYRKP